MKLYLIRHGQTDWNVAGRMQGSHDIELNEYGLKQAKQLYERIVKKEFKITKVYTSPQKRALKTAQILSEGLEIPCIRKQGLEEANFGDWEGLTWDEVQVKFPKEYANWRDNRRYAKAPNGECYQEVLDRVLVALKDIIEAEKENVAIVTHGAVIMLLQCYLTNTSFEEMSKFKPKNTGIITIEASMIK